MNIGRHPSASDHEILTTTEEDVLSLASVLLLEKQEDGLVSQQPSSFTEDDLSFDKSDTDHSSNSLIPDDDFNEKQKSTTATNDGHSEGSLPDGGYGWIVVACSFLLELFTEGPISAFGVFQEFYVNDKFAGKASNATIAMVGVLSMSSMAVLGVVTGKLCDKYGFKLLPFVGICLMSLGYLAASFATEPWHLLLTQGIMCGVGGAFTFIPAVVIPSQWFERRRGLATGIVNLGIGVGGIVWTQFDHLLIRKISIEWTLRLTALVVLVVCTLSLMLLKTYQTGNSATRKPTVGFSSLTDRGLVMYMVSSLLTGVGSLVPFYYLPGYAKDIGISASDGALITSVANAASMLGRLTAACVSDYFGSMFVLLCAYGLTSLSIFFVWSTTQNFAGTMAFGIIFGLGYGAIFTQTPAFIAKYFGVYTLPVYVGLYYSMSGVGVLLGPPVAGVILEKTMSWKPSFLALKLYAGIPMALASVAIVATKYYTSKKSKHK